MRARAILIVVQLLATFLGGLPALGAEPNIPELVARARAAVVLIAVEDGKGETLATGTGFFVSEDGKLITNAHVVKNGKRIVAKTENGAFYLIEKIVQIDSESDLALLQATARHVPFLALGEVGEGDIGKTVTVVGSPLGLEGSVSTGIVSAFREGATANRIQISAPISPGSSGSPVLDPEGKVIGVATYTMVGGQNVNFAIAAQAIRSLLARPVAKPGPGATAATADAASLENDPDYVEALRLLRVDQTAKALKLLNGVVKRWPDQSTAYFFLGIAYGDLNFEEDAINAYRKAIKLDPADQASWINLSLRYSLASRYPLARDAIEQAIKLDPTEPVAWRVRGIYYMGVKQPADAITAITTSIKLRPEDGHSWNLLAMAYRQIGQITKAAEAQREAGRLLARNSPAKPRAASTADVDESEPGGTWCLITNVPAGDSLSVRASPAMSSELQFRLYNGERVRVVGSSVMNGKTEWIPVAYGAAKGWVRSKYLTPAPN